MCVLKNLPVPNPSEFTVFLCPEYIDLVYKDVLGLPDIVEDLPQVQPPLFLLPDPQELPLLPPLLPPPLPPPPRPPPPPPRPRH